MINDSGEIIYAFRFDNPTPNESFQAGALHSTGGLLLEGAVLKHPETTLVEPRTIIDGHILSGVSPARSWTTDSTVLISATIVGDEGESSGAQGFFTQDRLLAFNDLPHPLPPGPNQRFGGARMNDHGDIVYKVNNVDNQIGSAIFINGDRLIGSGDTINDSLVDFVGTFFDINNRGDIAFTARLEDQATGNEITVLLVASVPEPAAHIVAVFGLLLMLGFRFVRFPRTE